MFCGDVTLWTSFWEQYHAVVHNSELPSITKFSYLLALLKGEAKACVQGLSLTASNYETACDILQKRFGRPERIIFSHIQELLKITVPHQPTIAVLWKMYYDLQAHMRSLEALHITGEQYGVVLTPLVLSRLPRDLRLEWAREGELHESDLGFLLRFLQRELERRERSQTFAVECVTSHKADVTVDTRPVSTVSALHTSTNKQADACAVCGWTGHTLDRCYGITKIAVTKRRGVLRGVKACFRCMRCVKGHSFRDCRAVCSLCKGRHHQLLCEQVSMDKHPITPPCNNDVVSCVNAVTGVSSRRVLLQTTSVLVQGKCGVVEAVILFDTGSDKSYISEVFVGTIGPEWVGYQCVFYAAFASNQASNAEHRNLYKVTLKGGGMLQTW